MICPNCGEELEEYAVENDIHTHWCKECYTGLILEDDKWITIEEKE
jgi:RNase P subunit RPR2